MYPVRMTCKPAGGGADHSALWLESLQWQWWRCGVAPDRAGTPGQDWLTFAALCALLATLAMYRRTPVGREQGGGAGRGQDAVLRGAQR